VDDSLAALRVACHDPGTLAALVREDDPWLPTGCRAWVVRGLLLHLLSEAPSRLPLQS